MNELQLYRRGWHCHSCHHNLLCFCILNCSCLSTLVNFLKLKYYSDLDPSIVRFFHSFFSLLTLNYVIIIEMKRLNKMIRWKWSMIITFGYDRFYFFFGNLVSRGNNLQHTNTLCVLRNSKHFHDEWMNEWMKSIEKLGNFKVFSHIWICPKGITIEIDDQHCTEHDLN